MSIASNLNPKQKKFCEEYIKDHNGTQAAIRAGYAKNSADVQASQLLGKLNIQNYIQKLADEATIRNKITVDRILQEIAHVAFLDVKDFYDENGNLKTIHDIDEAARRAINTVTTREEKTGQGDNDLYEIKTIKASDKLKALELLGKYKKMFADKVELTGKDGGPIETKAKVSIYIPDNGRD